MSVLDLDIITGLLPLRLSIHLQFCEVVPVSLEGNHPVLCTRIHNNNNNSCKREGNFNVPVVYRVMERVLGGTTFPLTKYPPILWTILPLEEAVDR